MGVLGIKGRYIYSEEYIIFLLWMVDCFMHIETTAGMRQSHHRVNKYNSNVHVPKMFFQQYDKRLIYL